MLIKPFDFKFKKSNSQRCIAAHLQGTQAQRTEPNLAKELQLPTHGKQFLIQRISQNLCEKLEYYKSLRENKSKQKNKGLRPIFFPFAYLTVIRKVILLPLCGIVCFNQVQ